MNDVTQILRQIEAGDPSPAEHLLPLIYEELRKLAAQKLAQEKPRPDSAGEPHWCTRLIFGWWM